MGPWNAGKSRAWCSIGAWLRRTGAPGRLYVIDTDRAVDRMAEEWTDFYNNVESVDAYEWSDYTDALRTFSKAATSDDWLVVDMIDQAWDAVQNHFVQEVFGKDASSFFLESRKAGDKGHPLAEGYGVNWNVINKLYASFMGGVIRWPGHVVCCTPVDSVQQPDRSGKGGDSRDVLDLYGPFGAKPRGQKALGFQFHTILLLNHRRDDKWAFTSIKDRGRDRPVNEQLNDFVMDYLVKVAKWEL